MFQISFMRHSYSKSAVVVSTRRLSRLTAVVVVMLSATHAKCADLNTAPIKAFLETHCADCHSGDDSAAGVSLPAVHRDLSDPAAFEKWVQVFDRVKLHEMPPPDIDQPSEEARSEFLRQLRAPLESAHQEVKGTVFRRLNRREYQNTLNDLFGTNLSVETLLPEDGRSHEFDNVGASLSVSMVQLQRYLEIMDQVLDASIQHSLAPPEVKTVRATYAETRDADRFIGSSWLKLDDDAVVFFRDQGYPSGTLREASVREAGFYKVRVTGYAYQSDRPVTFAVNGDTYARGAEKPTFGYFSVPPGEPVTVELTPWIESRYMIQIKPYGISDRNEIRQNGIKNYRGPGLAITQIEIEGPLVEQFPLPGHHLVFDGLNRREIMPRNPADRNRPWYQPKFEVVSNDAEADARRVLSRVATRAFRRPASGNDVTPYVRLFGAEMSSGATFEEALRTAVTAVFCSPDFLYLRESVGQLDDYALASRLSYFLTRTLPDDQLLQAAATGKLTTDPAEIRRQTERLLNDRHSARFIADFTDAWLNLRDIEFTVPDRTLFPEFDPYLQYSMVQETRRFFRQLIDSNLSTRNIVKSDFAMLNNRMAEHYGISGELGPEFSKVSLPADSVRGGLLSQASVLKVSANGTNTSPVVRGVWVMERILGQTPPPPPAGVPGVEPDIRGATTLRELLDRHRDLDTCRGCHQKIDPPGFALECFNPVGGLRDRFRSLGEGERIDLEVRGNRVRYRLGPAVDSSGELPDGSKFSGFAQFRDLIAENEVQITRAFATKLLTFATGRELGFSDRAEVDRIVQESGQSGYRIRDLIHAVVGSGIFRSK